MFWQENGTAITQAIPPKTESFRESTIAALNQPAPIYLQGRIQGNNQSVMLNGQQIFPVIATEVPTTVKIVFGDCK